MKKSEVTMKTKNIIKEISGELREYLIFLISIPVFGFVLWSLKTLIVG